MAGYPTNSTQSAPLCRPIRLERPPPHRSFPQGPTPMNNTKNQNQALSDLDAQHEELLRQVDDLDKRVLKALADCQPPRPQPAESEQ